MKGLTQNTSGFMKPSTQIALGILAGVSCAVFSFSSAVLAETAPSSSLPTSENPLKDLQTQDSTDPFSSKGNGQTGIFDLVHRAIQGPSRSSDEFNAEQKENLDSETEQFRAEQQRRLQGQGQVATPKQTSSTP